MKKLNKYRKSVQGLMLLTFGLTMAGCSAQDDFFTETSSESLSIKPSVTEATVSRAAVASDQTLREAALDNLYVKIFDKEYQEQSVNKKFDSNLQSDQKEVLGQGNWKVDLNLQENKDYFVYSIANAKEDLTQVNSLADLETKEQTDEDIWKPYSSDNATKNFLMTAINSKWTVSKEPTQTIESKLTRAAAKIVVNLKINVKGYEVVGEPTWQLLNYNTQTTLFGPNTAKNIASMSETATNEKMAKTTADGYQLVTYSYATSWDNNASAPQAKIKVMLKKDGETVDYYYSIPVRDPKETMSLERNYVYTANATVTSLGSSSDITYGDAMNLVYDVQKWTQGEETTINAGEQKYLLVSPTFMIMKNQRFDNSTIKFYGSGKCTVETVEIYYYDKNGNKQKCSGSQYFKASAQYADGHGELKDQGTIVIGDANNKTNDFVPLSVKYIKIKVTCDGVKDPVNVTIKQYPLEYIQGIAGWYSTKDEFTVTDWFSSTTYEGIDWQEDRTLHSKEKGSEDAHFFAKVKEPGDKYIYRYSDKRVSGKTYQAQKGSATEKTNNRMYVVQITNTPQNSKYKIGHVTNIDKNTKLSSEDVVSPAFMLASQLGTVYAFTYKNDRKKASEHCDKYIEVNTDGEKYTNWRLPTASEIGVITNYQYNKNQNVIDVVLAGGSYWALNGNQVEANKNNDERGFVRCVRDLSPEEVKELENKKE